MTAFPTLFLEKNMVAKTSPFPTPDPAGVAAYEAIQGLGWLTLLYQNDTAGGEPLILDDGTLNARPNHAACIAYLYERGFSPTDDPPKFAALDFEGVFDEWLTGSDEERVSYAVSCFVNCLRAVKAEFGAGIRLSVWGHPRVRYYAADIDDVGWHYADEVGREKRIQQASSRFAPIFAECDFYLPQCYVICPDAKTMDPATREHAVSATGWLTSAPGFDWSEQCENAMRFVEAGLEAIRRVRRRTAEYSKPIVPSISTFYGTFSPIFAASEFPQFVPESQFNAALDRFRTYLGSGPLSYHVWGDLAYFYWLASLPDVDPEGEYGASAPVQARMRASIVEWAYNGVSPVGGEFVSWQDPALYAEVVAVEDTGRQLQYQANNLSLGADMSTITYSDAAKSLRMRWKTFIEDALSIPTTYDNAPPRMRAQGQHALLSILWGENVPVSSPSGNRAVGVLSATLYTPAGVGDRSFTEVVQAVNAAFLRKTFDGVVCHAVQPTNVGEEKGFHKMVIQVRFYFNSTQ